MTNSRVITSLENERISSSILGLPIVSALRELDQERANGKRSSSKTVFDWGLRDAIKTRNWVGVVHVPGLTIEILPKITRKGGAKTVARANLVHMLLNSEVLGYRERKTAAFDTEHAPLLDALVYEFLERMVIELRKGVPHGYRTVEENAHLFKGRLDVARNIQQNHDRLDRVCIAYDEFTPDVLLPQVLKRACRIVAPRVRTAPVRQRLSEALHRLDAVDDRVLRPEVVRGIRFNRNTKRFECLMPLCEMLLANKTPNFAAGDSEVFSLLFPMELVFERFVCEVFQRNLDQLVPGAALLPKGGRRRRHLLEGMPPGDRLRRTRLEPDLLFVAGGSTVAVLDTKWKLPGRDRRSRLAVNPDDFYQLFAYAYRYQSPLNILLYPAAGASPARESYRVLGWNNESPPEVLIRVAEVDLSYDLRRDPRRLVSDLCQIFSPARPEVGPHDY